MKFILYSSEAKLNNIDLDGLLKAAITKNARLNITGFLISHSSGFIQYIEGDDQHIDELYTKISTDERHSNVVVLLDRQITKRIYQEWDMGHVYIDNDETIEKLLKTDSLKWFEYLKARTLFFYPHEFSSQLEKTK